jgi:hypothetical protein
LLGLPIVLPAAGNPAPLTDLGASLLPSLTGGTQRICATSGRGLAVHCVDKVTTLPSADQAATADTLGHWIFCKTVCGGSLLVHEMVHVGQFETYGDLFGPMYLAEGLVHGDGCANKWELPAYQATGAC